MTPMQEVKYAIYEPVEVERRPPQRRITSALLLRKMVQFSQKAQARRKFDRGAKKQPLSKNGIVNTVYANGFVPLEV